MITASHNKYEDNGLKICGEEKMLSKEWEGIYTKIINSKQFIPDLKLLIQELYDKKIATTKYYFRDNSSRLIVAYDSRKSSPVILDIIL